MKFFTISEETKLKHPKRFMALMLPNVLTNFLGLTLYSSHVISAQIFAYSFFLSVLLGPLAQFFYLKLKQ